MKFILLLLIFIGLTACQPNNKKQADTSEVNTLLTNITIDALKEHNFVQAQRSITALILSGDEKAWAFIQSALVSMPEDKSIQVIEAALKQSKVQHSSTHLFALAKVYISFKKTDEALKLINKSVSLDKNNLQARYWRARLLSILKDYTGAEKDFQYITQKDPDNEDYSSQYAAFFQETQQPQKAQEILSKQKATPDNLFKRIIFALQNKDEKTANAIYPKLKNLSVSDEQQNHLNFLIAESAYWLKNIKESEAYYNKVSGGDHYLDAREMLSLIYFDQKKYDESVEILHQLENAEQSYAVKAYRLESQIAQKQGDAKDAIEVLSLSLDIIPNNPELLYDRAMLYESVDNMKKAEKDLLKIIKTNPDNFEALNALGYSLADHDMKLDKAYEYVQKAIEIDPENAAIMDSVGWVQYKLGKYDEAEINFKKALKTDIKDPELYIHLYKTLLKLDKNKEAKDLIIKAKELFPEYEKLKKF